MSHLQYNSILRHGDFSIKSVIGQGGFGITYLATDSHTDKSIAIKEFFPKDFCTRDSVTGYVTMLRPEMNKYKKKFISEANKIAQLNHKGIIKVIEVFEENGTAYYAMEYIAGKSLFEILKQRRFSLEESLKIIGKVSKALAHIHSKRMLHLDIKPMNIMMRDSDKEPIIIDFGISKTYDTQGNPNTTFLPAASPGYSPAEQFEGEVNSFAPQLDIYSLGATLYSLLSGKIPSYPTPLTTQKLTFDRGIPDFVIDAIKTAMAYRQSDRFFTVNDFLTALRLIPTKTSRGEKPLIRSFALKSEAPYYVGDVIELSWSIQNCDSVYLNGKLQYGLRKSKTIKYSTSGKKRLTLKAVKMSNEVSHTINFNVLPKDTPIQDVEATNVILADLIANEKPVINCFQRSGTEKVYVGDDVSIYWLVKGADTIAINGEQVPKASKKRSLKVTHAGENIFTLTATNSAGITKKVISINVESRCDSKIYPKICYFTPWNLPKGIYAGDSVELYWEVKGADKVAINGIEVPKTSKKKILKVTHAGENIFTLTATNSTGTAKKVISINADSIYNPKSYPKICYFTPWNLPDVIYVGDSVELYWEVKGADKIIINGIEVPKASKKKVLKVNRAGENIFTLTAINSIGTIEKIIKINVISKNRFEFIRKLFS